MGGSPSEWDEIISRSPHGSPFHQWAGLELLAFHSNSTLHPLVGYKGNEPIGVLPVFERTKGPFTLVESPPKRSEVYYLGPAMTNVDSLKQKKYERRNRLFVDGCLTWIENNIVPDYTQIRTVDRYTDHRPFKAVGYDVSTYYTYVVDLTKRWDDLLMQFSRDARANVRNTGAEEYEIEIGGIADARKIIAQVRSRHDEQGKPYHITDAYLSRLFSEFPGEQVNPYIVRAEGRLVGGIVTLEYGDTIYRWQGGTKTAHDLPVNDLLDTHIIEDAMNRGLKRYDLVGANIPRLCRYKSKFAPELRMYHGARKRSRRASILSSLRRSLPIDV